MKAYYKSLEDISEKRRNELYDEGYADAEAELELGERLDEMDIGYHTDATKAWYSKGWNMAIEDYKKKPAVKGVMIDDLSDSEVKGAYKEVLKLMKSGDTRIGHPSAIADEFMATDIAEEKKYYYQDWGNDHIRGFKQPTVPVIRDVLRWIQRDHSEIWERIEEREAPAEEPDKDNLILDDIDMVIHDVYGLGMIYSYNKSKERRRYEINFPNFHQRKEDTNSIWSDDPKLKLVKRIEEKDKARAVKEWYSDWREGTYPIDEEKIKTEGESKELLDEVTAPAPKLEPEEVEEEVEEPVPYYREKIELSERDTVVLERILELIVKEYDDVDDFYEKNKGQESRTDTRYRAYPFSNLTKKIYATVQIETGDEFYSCRFGRRKETAKRVNYKRDKPDVISSISTEETERRRGQKIERKHVCFLDTDVQVWDVGSIRGPDGYFQDAGLIDDRFHVTLEDVRHVGEIAFEKYGDLVPFPTPKPEPATAPPEIEEPPPAAPKLGLMEQKSYDQGYADAKEYLDEGIELEIRELDLAFRGKTGVAYDRGWNDAIEEPERIDAEYVDVVEDEEPPVDYIESEAVMRVKEIREKERDIPIEELCDHIEPDDDITSLINIVNRFDTAEEFTDTLSTDRRRPFARITAILGYGEHRDTLSDVCSGALVVGSEEVERYAKQYIDCAKGAGWVYRGASKIKAGDFIALDYDVAVREGKPVYGAKIAFEDIVWTGLHEAEWYYVPKHLQERYKDYDGTMFFEKHKIVEEPEPEPVVEEPEEPEVEEVEAERIPEHESLMLEALEAKRNDLELPPDTTTEIEKEIGRLERELEEYFEYAVTVKIEMDDRDMYIISKIQPQYKEVFDRDPQTIYHSVENKTDEEKMKVLGEAIEEFINEVRGSMGRPPTDVYVKELEMPGRGTIPVRAEEEIARMAEDLGVEAEFVAKGKDFLKRMIDTKNRELMNPYRDAAIIEIVGMIEDKNMIRAVIDRWNLGAVHDVMAQAPSFEGKFPREVVDDLVGFQFYLPPDQLDNIKASGYDIENILKELKDELVIVTKSYLVDAKLKFPKK